MSRNQPAAPRTNRLALALCGLLGFAPPGLRADAVNWISNDDGNWSVAGNWSSSPALPGAADDARIAVAGAAVRTITHNSGTNTVQSLASEERLAVTGGSLTVLGAYSNTQDTTIMGGMLTLNGASTLATLTQSGSILAGTGNVVITGVSDSLGGTHAGAATTTLRVGGTISSNFALDAQRTLQNQGTLNWAAGGINLNGSAAGGAGRFDNIAGAVFDARGDNHIYITNHGDQDSVAGFGVFNNAGAFRKSAGAGATVVNVPLNNTGTVDVQTGTLSLAGGSTSVGGGYRGAGTLQFNGGTHTLDAGSSLATANATFGSGAATVNGVYNVADTTTVNNGTAKLLGMLTSIGTTLNINGGGALDTGSSGFSVVNFSQANGTLATTGDVTVTGTASLGGGTQTGAGTTTLQGGGTVSNNIALDAQRILRNQGALNWAAGNINLNGSATGGAGRIDNAAGAVFDARGNNQLHAANFGDQNSVAGFAVFNNAGTFRKSAGTGTTTINTAFNNTGTVDVQTGTLKIANAAPSFANDGIVRVSSGAVLAAAGLQNNGTGRIGGAGTIALDGGAGNLANQGALAPGDGGVGSLAVNGSLSLLSGGSLDIELAGPAGFDKLDVSQRVALGGALNLRAVAGYAPTEGDSFDFLFYGSVFGGFNTVNLFGFDPGLEVSLTQMPDRLRLSVVGTPVPLPAAFWLFGSTLLAAGLGTARPKKNAP